MPPAESFSPSRAIAKLPEGFFDVVEPARFPAPVLRFRNQRWAERVGLGTLTEAEWAAAFARFEPLPGSLPEPLALRYHGHQFRAYNPDLGDGRGFLLAQLMDPVDGRLLDLGTKGSGTTPYSRGGDGRLTLKGGGQGRGGASDGQDLRRRRAGMIPYEIPRRRDTVGCSSRRGCHADRMILLAPILAACLAADASAATAAGAPAAPMAAVVASKPTPFVELGLGEFGFVGGQRQRDHVAAAVERTVQSLPGLFHDIARKRLTDANTIPRGVRISMDGDELVVVYGDNEPQRAPLDGSTRKWRNPQGETIDLKHELRGSKLVQTTWGSGGRRVMVWSFDPERGLLRVQSTMSSPRLPEPVRYRLSFKAR